MEATCVNGLRWVTPAFPTTFRQWLCCSNTCKRGVTVTMSVGKEEEEENTQQATHVRPSSVVRDCQVEGSLAVESLALESSPSKPAGLSHDVSPEALL